MIRQCLYTNSSLSFEAAEEIDENNNETQNNERRFGQRALRASRLPLQPPHVDEENNRLWRLSLSGRGGYRCWIWRTRSRLISYLVITIPNKEWSSTRDAAIFYVLCSFVVVIVKWKILRFQRNRCKLIRATSNGRRLKRSTRRCLTSNDED